MKKDYTLTAYECQYMQGKRYEMGAVMYEFMKLTGYGTYYERQGYNGTDGSNWIWVGVGNLNYNNGDGYPIGVDGYTDAIYTLKAIIERYREHGVCFSWEVK